MKLKKVIVPLLITGAVFANTEIIESTPQYQGMFRIEMKTTATVQQDGLFAETKAKIKALSKAKFQAKEAIAKLCPAGTPDGSIDHTDSDCDITDKNENIAICEVQTETNCNYFSGIKSKPGLNLRLGNIAPSTACVERLKENFSVDDEMINLCNGISTEIQYECVEQVSQYGTMKTYAIQSCSKFSNEMSLNLLKVYTGDKPNSPKYAYPNVPILNAFAKVTQDSEETCMLNKLKGSSVGSSDLKECLPKTVEGRTRTLLDRLRDFIF